MNFKMSFDDFKLLSLFIDKKAKGSVLKIVQSPSSENKLTIQVETQIGETAIITFFDEGSAKFPEITKTNRLGDEI